jgi:DNA (cytosine-5)-methyltransferase 1
MRVDGTAAARSLISLFSGCGGFDLGFRRSGFVATAAFDCDRIAVEHYRRNLRSDAHVADLSRDFPFPPRGQPAATLLAGPPCQGFSTVGRRDPNDPRNYLLPLVSEFGARLKPLVLVVENVAGALSGPHVRHWAELEYRLRLLGYRTHTVKANALDFGMAQLRRRLFLFAWRTNRDVDFHMGSVKSGRLDHVLFGVESQQNHAPKPLRPGTRLHTISRRIGPGQKLSNVRGGPRSVHTWNIPEVFGATTAAECALLETLMALRRSERRRDFGDADPVSPAKLERELSSPVRNLIACLVKKGYLRRIGQCVDLVHTFNGKCRRFRWDDVACTVDTRFGDPHLFLHPNENRPFTVREAARIQGFPDQFTFTGPEKDQFRLIGNAVPPAMASGAATIVRRLLSL